MLIHYLILSARNILKRLSLSLINIAGLTMCISACLFLAHWLNDQVTYDKFHDNYEKIFMLIENRSSMDGGNINSSSFAPVGIAANIESLSPFIDAKASIFSSDRWPNVMCFKSDSSKECTYNKGIYVTSNFFEFFDFKILLGSPNPLEKSNTISISENMAIKLFSKPEDAISQTIKMDNYVVEVVAVHENTPKNSSIQFDFAANLGLYRALRGLTSEDRWKNIGVQTYYKANGSEAPPTIAEISSPLLEDYKNEKATIFFLFPFKDWHLKSEFKNGKPDGGLITYVVLFSSIGLLILIMAAINYANIMLAQVINQAKTVGVRKVSGATQSQIIYQYLVESIMIILIAACLSMCLILFIKPFAFQFFDYDLNITLNWEMLQYLTLIIVFLIVTAGIYPALLMSKITAIKALKLKASPFNLKIRHALIFFQILISSSVIFFLLILNKQVSYISQKSLGIDRHNIIKFDPSFNLLTKYEVFKNELKNSPYIEGVTATSSNPIDSRESFVPISWPGKIGKSELLLTNIGATNDFNETFKLNILEGSTFVPNSVNDDIQVILSEDALKLLGIEHPIGQEITLYEKRAVIVGISDNVISQSLHNKNTPTIITLLNPQFASNLYVRYTPGKLEEAFEDIAVAYNEIEPDYSMKYWFMDDLFDKQYKSEQLAVKIFSILTIIAITISILGLIGLSTLDARARLKELAVRRVLGCNLRHLFQVLIINKAKIVLASSLVAIPLVYYLSRRWLNNFHHRIEVSSDIFIIGLASLIVLMVLIIVLSVFKFVYKNPAEVLRSE